MLLEHIERVVGCRSMHDLWDLHLERMAEHGFTRLLYGFTRARVGDSLGPPDEALLLSTHPAPYVRRYIRDGLFRDAPMTRWCMSNVGASSWSWIAEEDRKGTLSDSERKVVQFNRQHGLVAGYTISFPDASPRTKAAMSLGARPGLSQDEVDAIWAENGREIAAMNNVFHLRIGTLPRAGVTQPLTDRQREVLEWVADGHSTADIASGLGVTQATVEKHLRLARAALGADTTAQAVLKACHQNQIFSFE